MSLCEGRNDGPGQHPSCPELLTDVSAADDDVCVDSHVHCELLCFLKQKCSVMTFDDLLSVSASFYTVKEVEKARSVLSGYVVEKRLGKHKGSDKEKVRKIMSDLLKVCLDPSVQLPQFYALDISRLPPVGIDHVDISAVLQELMSLRQEVRMVSELREEIEDLKKNVKSLTEGHKLQVLMSDVDSIHRGMDTMDFPPLATGSMSELPRSDDGVKSAVSFAQRAKELKATGLADVADLRRTRKPAKTVIGVATNNQRVTSVKTYRSVDVFVSRLHPSTAKEELVDCVNSCKGELQVDAVTCTKLQAKHEHLYASFWVAIRVAACDMKKAIDLFMSADAWPYGVLARRYFVPKNG